jgi:hypothetical protein
MTIDRTQTDELCELFGSVSCATEGGVTLYAVPQLLLPVGCTPSSVEVLLCPTQRDGYDSRLYFAQHVQSRCERNWAQHRLLDRNWWAFSWRTYPGLRLAQMITIHLDGLK